MFEGFSEDRISVGDITIFVRHSKRANAKGLLLLHGYPQTSAMWHGVAPLFTDQYHVVCADLRGYGRSSKPVSDNTHATYSKRAMATDMVDVMAQLGHQEFIVGAHDRGARVAHRMALDHPEKVRALTLLDIAPTREMYQNTSQHFATAYWHWFFLIQKYPLPEHMIGKDPENYWKLKCFEQSSGDNPFSPDALEEYLQCFSSTEAIHASCEDYRAAATIDIAHDDADKGKKISPPLQVLWAKRGVIESCFDALALWKERAEHVEGLALDGTHYMAEEIPEEIVGHMQAFFNKHTKA